MGMFYNADSNYVFKNSRGVGHYGILSAAIKTFLSRRLKKEGYKKYDILL